MHVNTKRIVSLSPNPHSSAFLTSPNFPLDAWMEPVLTRGGSSLRWSYPLPLRLRITMPFPAENERNMPTLYVHMNARP